MSSVITVENLSKKYIIGHQKQARFIALINRERFDCTEWRKNQWQDEAVKSLATRARTLRGIDSLRDIGHKEIENARDRI